MAEEEWARRVRAAALIADLKPPELASALNQSESTLNRNLKRQTWRPYEREAFLRQVAKACGLSYEFFTAERARLKVTDDPDPQEVAEVFGVILRSLNEDQTRTLRSWLERRQSRSAEDEPESATTGEA